ncbi:tetraacyldisaccharide 4'-kinase [Gilvibacter sediminis]|uniref:tetraacyldisaccharide 4'-kinase n=1 Tax=Gilvibacter sediminis TaxID=379071 RepID=UPI002350BE13|nr:tetraacyldisaccharide 4'-kinase [Gilvibacter sediminis]MDC7998547.1 tetraacyldisaccharide 4'-kinase [Gilvibacter sediminis]
MAQLRKMLTPFSMIYHGVTAARNLLYDKGVFTSEAYDIPVICVGNLTVGGTGKSPMIEYLIRLLKDDFKVAVLSRGYKRSTSGFLYVESSHTSKEVGDEPLQFKTKYPGITVAVCADRREGIEKLKPKAEVILLDDAFQHRRVKAGYTILLTTFEQPFLDDQLLPAGDLRESKAGAKRADAVVITKIPEKVAHAKVQELEFRLREFTGKSVYKTKIAYGRLIKNDAGAESIDYLKDKPFTLVTGIANPEPLVNFLRDEGCNFDLQRYPDHHEFTSAQINLIEKRELVITTEKDYMRLRDKINKKALYYLPIETAFLDREGYFESEILDFVHTYWNKIV